MKRRVWMKRVGAGALAAPSFGGLRAAYAAPDAANLALVGGTAWTGVGARVEDATVIVRSGRIERVVKGAAALGDMTQLDCRGQVVTPGLVALGNAVGLVEIELEPSTDDAGSGVETAIRPAFAAYDGYNPASSLVPVARLEGITSVVPFPDGGLISGTGAWFDLGAGHAKDLSPLPYAAVRVNLTRAGVRAGGGARPEAFARLREALDDAQLYGRSRAAFDRAAMRTSRVSRLGLERLLEVLSGRLPLVVEVARQDDILRVLELAKVYRVRVVLFGAEEAWAVAGAIAEARVPVVVRPLTNLPSEFDRLGSRYDNATLLHRAGVAVSLATPGPHDARHLRQEVGSAMGHGLAEDVALAAVTSAPARLFGLERDYGTLEPGRVANVVVWKEGSPFESSSWVTAALVRGVPMPMRSRQTALFERYRTLPARGTRETERW